MVGHDLNMRILYQFQGWLIFTRVIALFLCAWPYVRPHILCTQLVICLLSHFIHIWYLGWPWYEYAHIIPISRMVDFCQSYSPFHVCLTIGPFAHLVYANSNLSFVHIWYVGWPWSEHVHIIPISRMADHCESHSALSMFVWPHVRSHILCTELVICLLSHFIHIWHLDWPWSEYSHIIPISWMVDFCDNHSPFHVCLTIRSFAHLVYATSHLSFVAFYSYLVSWLARR